jgi:hypothetical protein
VGGFEAVDPRYQALYDRAVEVLEADPRVLSVRAGGSIRAGTADAWSDLDLEVVVAGADHEAFLAERHEWLAAITPTVFSRTPILPFIINSVTADGLTFDVVVWADEIPDFPPPPVRFAVGLLSGQTYDDVRDALEYAVAEQLRGLVGPFVTFLQRDEHLFLFHGIPHILGALTTVFLAETGRVPPAGKRWNDTYTEEQRAAVAALPPASATREGSIAFGLGLAELLLTRARPLFDRYDLEWPAELARVAADRIHDQLGIDISTWCY